MEDHPSTTSSTQPNPNARRTSDSIEFLGARTHNLKGIDVRIPHQLITVITGPSGCGKSSLAFDTVYAEAKRQFLDSLSFQARQALQYLPRPDIQHAEGLLPVVCIGQQPTPPNYRSTVSTVTSIHDYLRLLMTRIGVVKCHSCQQVIDQSSTDQIEQSILSLPERTRVMILAQVPREVETVEEQIKKIRNAGFVRLRAEGEIIELDSFEGGGVDSQRLEAVVDRIIVKPGIEDRVSESVAHALKFSDGNLCVLSQPSGIDEWSESQFSTLYSCPNCGESYEEIEARTFSYFSPFGVCLQCEGSGTVEQFSFAKIFLDSQCSIGDLKILQHLPDETLRERQTELNAIYAKCNLTASDAINVLDKDSIDLFFKGNSELLGFQTVLEKIFVTCTDAKLIDALSEFRAGEACPTCKGSRLCVAANNVFLADKNIGQIVQQDVLGSIEYFTRVGHSLEGEKQEIAAPILQEILNRLNFLAEVGVGYLSLDRRADSLSGGEFQRVRLATGLGNRLTDVCYILDEPTAGLHPADNKRLLKTIEEVKELGNTVVIVEHDPAAMKIADFILDLGPGAGESGGSIEAEGSYQDFLKSSKSLTASYLRGDRQIARVHRRELPQDDQWVTIHGVTLHNLQNVNFRFPTGRLTCVTGVSGSGKSSMVMGTLIPAILEATDDILSNRIFESIENAELIHKVVQIDQNPIGRSQRSNAATFTGIFDEIRKVFAKTKLAKQRGLTASHFSFNNKTGACSACKGHGQIKVEMRFMPDVHTICQACQGHRFGPSILEVEFKSKNIAQVLELSVSQAIEYFDNIERIKSVVIALEKVGLGYLKLGQPAPSLSGGESQRLKIANCLANGAVESTLYVLDEPTNGLHFAEIERLHGVLQDLVDQGHTVVLVEHHLDLIKNADYVVDFGPGGGKDGGLVIAAGTPDEIASCSSSTTGRFLAELGAHS